METTNLNVRVNKDLKTSAELIADALGMNLTTAVNIFLRQMVAQQGMPFPVRLTPNAETRQALEDAMHHRNLSGPYTSLNGLLGDLDDA